jgi:hypothetical protein
LPRSIISALSVAKSLGAVSVVAMAHDNRRT